MSTISGLVFSVLFLVFEIEIEDFLFANVIVRFCVFWRYNGDLYEKDTDSPMGFILQNAKLLGGVRMRQIRVKIYYLLLFIIINKD